MSSLSSNIGGIYLCRGLWWQGIGKGGVFSLGLLQRRLCHLPNVLLKSYCRPHPLFPPLSTLGKRKHFSSLKMGAKLQSFLFLSLISSIFPKSQCFKTQKPGRSAGYFWFFGLALYISRLRQQLTCITKGKGQNPVQKENKGDNLHTLSHHT